MYKQKTRKKPEYTRPPRRRVYSKPRTSQTPDIYDEESVYEVAKALDHTRWIVVNCDPTTPDSRSKNWRVNRILPSGRPIVEEHRYGSRDAAVLAAKGEAEFCDALIIENSLSKTKRANHR